MNQGLAAKIGRPDVGDMGGASYYPGSTPGAFAYVGAPDAFDPATDFGGGISAGADFGGRLSAGFLAIMVVGLGAFYLWTRSYQA